MPVREVIRCRAFALVLVPFLLATAPAHAETLRDALAAAYAGNPQLQSERAKLRATDETVSEALANWRPSASAQTQGGFSHQEFDQTSGNLKPKDASISVTQPLWRGGRTVAATRQAKESVMQERAQLADTEQNVLVNTATAYMDVLRDEKILALHTDNEKMLNDYLSEASERAQIGEKTKTDVSQAQARLLQAQADRNTAQTNLKEALSTYERLVAPPSGGFEEPELKLNLPRSRQAAIDQAVAGNPAVAAAEHAMEAQGFGVDEARGNLLPELSLQGSASRTWDENVPQQFINDNHTENDQVVMQLKVPLYTGGADYARIREARQQQTSRQRDLDEARREAAEKATQAWDETQTARQNTDLHRQQVEAAEATLSGMESEERAGDRTSTDRLNAQQELLQARIAEVQAEHDHMVASFKMMAAVGEFTADKLDLGIELYDPVKHYDKSRNRWFGTSDSSPQ